MSDKPMTPILTGFKQIAAFLGVSEDIAHRWAKEENLPIARIAGITITTRNLLELWATKRAEKYELSSSKENIG